MPTAAAVLVQQPTGSQIYGCKHQKPISVLSRKSLPEEKWRVLRELQTLEAKYNWMTLFFVGVWVASGLLFLHSSFFVFQIACYFLMACCVNALPILMHEGCHSLLHKNPMVNRWLGFFCGLPGLVSVSAYRSIHLIHHGHTRSKDDPDDIENSPRQSMPLVLIYYVVLLVGIYIYIFTVPVVGFQKAQPRAKKNILAEYGMMLGIYTALFILVPFEFLLHLWLIPLVIAGQLSNVRGLAEHGLTTGGNEFTDTRTVLSNRFVSLMMCNLNYHLEHHLFPGIPWYNLPKVHAELNDVYRRAGSSVYSSYTRFLIDFFRTTWGNQIVPHFRLIPAHIREEICL
ncbi:MAG TPA: fatty acid desaturase [Bacteroidota bacterium]|nr:fatty acid desaturase [Bacteroidota bacterium]